MDFAPAIKTVKTAAYCGCSDTVDINQIKWNRKNNHLFKSSSCQMVAISNSSSYKTSCNPENTDTHLPMFSSIIFGSFYISKMKPTSINYVFWHITAVRTSTCTCMTLCFLFWSHASKKLFPKLLATNYLISCLASPISILPQLAALNCYIIYGL